MVERPKKPSRRARPTLHEVAVLLETMRGENRKAVQIVDARLQSFREEFQTFREDVDASFQKVDTRFDRVEHDIVLIKDAVIETTRELKRNWVAVDKKVDRDEVEGIVEGVVHRGG